jgi:hypothetical protein
MFKSRWLLPAIAIPALIAAACGGDDKPSASSAAGETPRAADAVSLAQSAESLRELTSFRFDVAVELEIDNLMPSGGSGDPTTDALAEMLLGVLDGLTASGTVVAPDSAQIEINAFGQNIGLVQIGENSWVNMGDGWQESETGDEFAVLPEFKITDLYEGFVPEEVLSGAETSEEEVNGVQTIHYSFDKESLIALAQELGEDTTGMDAEELDTLDLDVWLTEDYVPVRVVLSAAGSTEEAGDVSIHFELNLYDINNDGLTVVPPL